MRFVLARGWLPAIISYSDDLPADMGGFTLTLVAVIRPEYRHDQGLHEHQLEHVVQWYAVLAAMLVLATIAYLEGQAGVAVGLALASVGMHGLLHRRFRSFRLSSESRAFARQIQFPDRHGRFLSLDAAAARLCSPRYDLGLSQPEAVARIRGSGKEESAAPDRDA